MVASEIRVRMWHAVLILFASLLVVYICIVDFDSWAHRHALIIVIILIIGNQNLAREGQDSCIIPWNATDLDSWQLNWFFCCLIKFFNHRRNFRRLGLDKKIRWSAWSFLIDKAVKCRDGSLVCIDYMENINGERSVWREQGRWGEGSCWLGLWLWIGFTFLFGGGAFMSSILLIRVMQ